MRIKLQTRGQDSARAHSRTAFTIVEVMMAVGISGFLFTTLYLGISQGFRVIQSARENLRATQILQEKLETIRLYTWDQINSNGFIPPSFTAPFYSAPSYTSDLVYTGAVSFANVTGSEPYKTDMRAVTFNLTWNSGGVEHLRTMSTFISRHGLQNYIY